MSAQRTNFLIIHGTLSNPEGNWFSWLRKKLEQDGHKVFVPSFPTPEGQSFNGWMAVAQETLKDIDPAEIVLIGHSMGALFALALAEKSTKPYKAVFALSPFMSDLNLEPYDTLNSSFTQAAYNWPRIKQNAKKIFCWAGNNDPYVPLACSQEVADNAGASLMVIKNGGHLNAEAGYVEFPLLLDKIREVV